MPENRSPRHLSPESKRLWRETTRVYQLEARHLTILTVALEALDRLRQAQAEIARDGLTSEGRFGPKAHPAVAIERDSRIAFLRATRELGLDLETAASRPPSPWRS